MCLCIYVFMRGAYFPQLAVILSLPLRGSHTLYECDTTILKSVLWTK
jgi:hypothetical protein